MDGDSDSGSGVVVNIGGCVTGFDGAEFKLSETGVGGVPFVGILKPGTFL